MSAATIARTGFTAQPRRTSFADLSVNVKVLLAVATAAVVALIVGITGLVSLASASKPAQLIYESNVASDIERFAAAMTHYKGSSPAV